jgi:hypothetical protein
MHNQPLYYNEVVFYIIYTAPRSEHEALARRGI